MNRRRFLASTSALVPLAFLEPALLPPHRLEAETLAALPDHPAAQPHVIPAGGDVLSEHHSLGFSTISFKVVPRQTSGNLFLIEHTGLRKGGGPPLHLHYAQDEFFYVLEGTLLFQVGDQRVQVYPGESLLGPRRIPHTFTCVSDQPAHLLIAFTPAGQMEDFFRAAGKPGASLSDPALFASHGLKLLGPPLSAG